MFCLNSESPSPVLVFAIIAGFLELYSGGFMTQSERQFFLIKELISEKNEYKNIQIPSDDAQQKILLRSLMNIREAKNADKKFLEIQDEYLQNELMQKGITDINKLLPVKKKYLSLERRHYNIKMRCNRKCCKQCNDRLL